MSEDRTIEYWVCAILLILVGLVALSDNQSGPGNGDMGYETPHCPPRVC